MKLIKLGDGNEIPQIGLGVWQAKPKECQDAVKHAVSVGYAHIDTAAIYKNERDVGKALKEIGAADKTFITTKLHSADMGYDKALEAFEESHKKLGKIDLYLIHSPQPENRLESWRALMKLKEDGKVRSIGVSNYSVKHLEELHDKFGVHPAINQVEMHPFCYHHRKELVEYCRKHNIVIEAYSPVTRGKYLKDDRIVKLAKKYKKTEAQVLLQWGLQMGFVILPKSVTPSRIEENFNIDFQLDKDDFDFLSSFEEDNFVCWNPLTWE